MHEDDGGNVRRSAERCGKSPGSAKGIDGDTPLRYAQPMDYADVITVEPGIRGGKPCIRGMRITVYDILSYLAAGMSHSEILDDFPYLTRDDILACLAYAADRERSWSSHD